MWSQHRFSADFPLAPPAPAYVLLRHQPLLTSSCATSPCLRHSLTLLHPLLRQSHLGCLHLWLCALDGGCTRRHLWASLPLHSCYEENKSAGPLSRRRRASTVLKAKRKLVGRKYVRSHAGNMSLPSRFQYSLPIGPPGPARCGCNADPAAAAHHTQQRLHAHLKHHACPAACTQTSCSPPKEVYFSLRMIPISCSRAAVLLYSLSSSQSFQARSEWFLFPPPGPFGPFLDSGK